MMDSYAIIRTVSPLLLLMGLGALSRKTRILKSGDERVLSTYVYYFALPALFIINLAETNFTVETLRFGFVGLLPIFIVLVVFVLSHLILRFSKNTLYLIILSTVFGSLSFFGIPFVTFAFPAQGERLGTLASAFISPICVVIAITVLELYRIEQATIWMGLTTVVRRLTKNPLLLSIFSGVLLSLTGIEVPSPLSDALHMLGRTTSTVAIFMLGVFLYGRQYTQKVKALQLSLLRIVFLPLLAFLTTTFFTLHGVERSIVVLMHGMPVAISLIILSERYDFYTDIIASLIFFSSFGAFIYLNMWLILLSVLGIYI